MATSPNEFIELAAELIGDEFAEFALPAVMTESTGFDYETQEYQERSQTIPMIRLEFSYNQFGGSSIASNGSNSSGGMVKIGDYQLVGEQQKLSWMPSPDNTTMTYGGMHAQVVRVIQDPANAAIILHVRNL